MKTLFDASASSEILGRINSLTPASQRQWGKMNVDQMLAHCSAGFDMASGEKKLPRLFIGRVLGRFIKKAYTNEHPFRKNSPTDNYLRIVDQRDFEKEREKLIEAVKKFQAGGEAICTSHPHPFFGELQPWEWGKGMYKHMDHHLTQFGV